jgi:hypothetical protein
MISSKSLFWALFSIFVACAFYFDWHENLFAASGPLAALKVSVWTAFFGFLGYTIYCSSREDLLGSVRKLAELHWGRQIGVDLYLGSMLALLVIYLNEGSVLVALLWLLPMLVFVNLASLLYFAIHFDSIVGRFLP